MERDIATGRINIDLNDADAIAGLRKVDAEFDRLMNHVERSKASATIDADISLFKKGAEEARRELKKLEGEQANPKLALDADEFKTKLKAAKAKVKEMDGLVATIELEVEGDKEAIARMKAVEAANEHLEREVAKSLKRTEAARAAHTRTLNKEARAVRSLADQQIREMRTAETAAHKMETARTREATATERAMLKKRQELREIPKLEKAYASLTAEVQRLERAQIKAGKKRDAGLVFRVDIDRRIAMNELEKVREELSARLGRDPIKVPLQFPRITKFGATLRREMDDFETPYVRSAAGVGLRAGAALGNGVADGFRKRTAKSAAFELGGLIAGGTRRAGTGIVGKMGDFASKIADMTVRIGPFTATIRAAVLGLALLGPIIIDVVGSLGALAAVAGSGVVGALGAATGALGAFGVMGISVGLLLPQLLEGYKQLGTLQDAFHAAQDQHGKGSKEATEALEKYNNALAASSPQARAAFEGMKGLKAQVKSLSKGVQDDFDRTTLSGVRAGKSLLTAFGPQMQASFKMVSSGVRAALKGISGGEGKAIIGNLFKNGLDSLPAFGKGLSNLAHAAGLVASAFSNMLPSLGGGFKEWTEGILNFTKDSGKMERFVEKTTTSMQKLGHFLASGGRLMATFFGGGVGAGQDFLDTMTKAMDRWNAFLGTTQGQNDLDNFFRSGVSGLQAFYSAIAPVVSSFVAWSSAIAPVTRGIFLVVGAVSQFVGGLLAVTALRGPLAALGATLAVLWGLGKIRAATAAVSAFGAALRGVAGTQKALAATNAMGAFGTRNVPKAAPVALPIIAGGSGALGGAAKGAESLTKLGRAGAAARTGMAGLGALVTGIASPMAGLGVLAVGAAAGIYLLATRTKSWEKSAQAADQARRRMYAGLEALPGLTNSAADAQINLEQSQLSAAQSARDLKSVNAALTKEQEKSKPNMETLNQLYRDRQQLTLTNRQNQLRETTAVAEATAAQKALGKQAREAMKDALANRNSRQSGANKRGNEFIIAAGDNEFNGTKISDAYKKIAAGAKEAGMSLKEFAESKGLGDNDVDKLTKYAHSLKQIENANKAARKAYDDVALSQVNQARITNKQIPLNEKAAAAFGALTRIAGKDFSAKIATKFDDPNKAAKVGASAAAALKRGAGKTEINAAIKANPKDALAAARAINAIKLSPKTLSITQRGAEAVRAKLVGLVGTKLADKVMTIIGSSESAEAKLRALRQLKLPPAVLRILGDSTRADEVAAAAERKKLDAIIQEIRRVLTNPDFTGPPVRPVVQNVRRVFGGNRLADGGQAFASGGYSTNPNQRQQERAATRASMAGSPQKAVSQKITSPKYLVGEEASPEFVIATNPAYRDRNLKYLDMAARALGTKVEDRHASGFSPGGSFTPTNYVATKMKDAKPRTYRSQLSKQEVKNVPKGKKLKLHGRAETPWVARVQALEVKQEDWAREVSFRESQVKEPEDFMRNKADGSKVPGTDEPMQEVDTDAVTAFRNSLTEVQKAYTQLKNVIAGLAEAIPNAITEMSAQMSARKANRDQLNTAMKTQLSLAKGSKGKAKERAQKRAQDYKEERDKQQAAYDEAMGNRKELKDKRKDTGFDMKETAQVSGENDARIAALDGDASKQVSEANVSRDGSSGAAGGDTAQSDSLLAQSEARRIAAVGDAKASSDALAAFSSSGDIGVGGFKNAITAAAAGSTAGAMRAVAESTSRTATMQSSSAASGMRSGITADSSVNTSGISSSAGVAGTASATTSPVNVTINTLHPGDPQTLAAIAGAATAGFAQQNPVGSSTVGVGL